MLMPPTAAAAYQTWWPLVTSAAAARNPDGSYQYTPADLSSAASAVSKTVGGQYASFNPIGLSQLFGVARGIERSSDVLTAAGDGELISGNMISEPPWSRPAAEQAAAPIWQVRAEVTYRAPDGTEVTTWGTGVFNNVLPTDVGSLRSELELQLARMLSRRNEQTNTGGELLNVGRTYLMAV